MRTADCTSPRHDSELNRRSRVGRRLLTAPVLLAAAVVAPPPCAHAASIWVEGEDAAEQSVTPHGWYNGVKKDVLSGGEWLSHFDAGRPGSATYEVEAPAAGDYAFWVRANPVKASLAYRLNGGEWTPIDLRRDPRGQLNIAADNKPDLRFIAWVKAGKVPLRAGANQLQFRMDSGPQNHGALDCFCLTTEPWVPSGTAKPLPGGGAAADFAPAGPADWFPAVFDDDPLSPDSVTDVSHLVEAPAGGHGFLRRDGDALRFERAAAPTKFWAVGAPLGRKTPAEMVQAARWLRKHGVNLVRQHTVLAAVGLPAPGPDGGFDPARMDRYDRWFAALKEEGIYTAWSVIYPHHGAFLRKIDGADPEVFAELDRADKNRDGAGGRPVVTNDFINLDRGLQDIVLGHFQKLLDHRNPHTGLRYRDDPALAVLEFQNESNVFFHTLNGLRSGDHPHFARKMRRAFFEFAKQKYRSESKLARAWGGRWDRDDDWEGGELGLMGAYHWGADGPLHEFAGQHRRAGDYIEFLTGLQRGYYERREKEVRAAGFRGVTVTTAWKSGGAAASLANLYADTAADCIDRHNYTGGGDGVHRIVEGKVETATHLDRPGRGLLALALHQVEDRPFAVSEWSMLPPSPYKAEAAPLVAFYGLGLQGWDASYHFNCGSHRMGDGWSNLSKYVSETPHYFGQFPALATAVHRGHIREGAAVAAGRVSVDDDGIFAGRDVLGRSLSAGSHDAKELAARGATPPEAVAAGKVTVAFKPGRSPKVDLGRLWDEERKVITANTGQLVWRYGPADRFVEVRSPKTQAVVGFAGTGSGGGDDDPGGRHIDLPDVALKVKTPFVSILFTPLDDRDLAQSRHILITAMARDKQTGTVYSEDGSRLEVFGGPPLLMEPVQAAIKLRGDPPKSVRPLDLYGVPREQEVARYPDGAFNIDGRHRTYYYEVRR